MKRIAVVMWKLLFIYLVFVLLHLTYGCENSGISSLRDKLTYSHLVLKGQVTKQVNESHFVFSVICLYKDGDQRVHSNITVEAVTKDQEDGMCFYNEYKVGKQYIIFLRRFDTQLRSTYKEEEVEKEALLIAGCGLKVINPDPLGGKAVGCPKIVHTVCPTSTTARTTKRTKPRRTKPRRTKPTTTTLQVTTPTLISVGKKSHRSSSLDKDSKEECNTSCVVLAVVFSIAGGAGLSGLGVLYYRKFLYKVQPDEKPKIDQDPHDKGNTDNNKNHRIINVATADIEVSKPPTFVNMK